MHEQVDDPQEIPPDNQVEFIQLVDGRLNYESHIILIVDDEPPIRHLIAREVQHAAPGTLTMEAGDGYEALEKLADIRDNFKVDPLFIILDLHMPQMDGWTFLEHLKNAHQAEGNEQGTPVIVLSSTSGIRGHGPFKKSVHGPKAPYSPLVSVAKEDCVAPQHFDALGQEGLSAWVRHFVGR